MNLQVLELKIYFKEYLYLVKPPLNWEQHASLMETG